MNHRWILFAILLVLLVGCGRGGTIEPTPTPMPTPTAIPSLAPSAEVDAAGSQEQPSASSAGLDLVGTELLTASGVTVACDSGAGATITCSDQGATQQITVESGAPTFARWTLDLGENAGGLIGTEVLVLTTESSGELSPNLYLVERGGDRIPVPVQRHGFQPGRATIHLPLQEISDDAGNRPDFSQVGAIQLVFEWADMAGDLMLESLRFAPVWEEPVAVDQAAVDLAAALGVPDGFTVTPIVDDFRETTQLQYVGPGELLVSGQYGRIWRYLDQDGDGVFDLRRLYTTGFTEIVGLLYDPVDGAIWLGGRGQLFRTLDENGDGVADLRELRVDGLPWGRHQNNGLAWNPDPDPFTGEPGNSWIYFGLGSTGDLDVGGELNATILRFPRDGQGMDDLEVVSRGNRNPYQVVWAPVPVDLDAPDGPTAWQLFASENGPDFNDAPDEVNHIRWGHHFGFPDHFGPVDAGEVDGDPISGPIYPVTPHASASGIAYVTNPAWPAEYRTLYVSLFGQVFSPEVVGHTVEHIALRTEETADGGVTYRGEPSDFVTGLDRPLGMTTDPDGNLLVADYATGVIYRVTYTGQ